jgi:hypothetical protein
VGSFLDAAAKRDDAGRMTAYLLAWVGACLVAAVLVLRRRHAIARGAPAYARFLAHRWKLVTGALAAGGLIAVTPWAREVDYTWDFVNATFMAALAFTTAPWVVGTLYRALRGEVGPGTTYIAVCVWMFSVSWSYDAWHLLDHGVYPPTWAANIIASSCLYLPAGLFWNLGWTEGRGLHFAFTEPGWPQASRPAPFRRIAPAAAPLMALAGAQILYFLV